MYRKADTYANSVDPHVTAHQDIHCLPFSIFQLVLPEHHLPPPPPPPTPQFPTERPQTPHPTHTVQNIDKEETTSKLQVGKCLNVVD